MATIFSQIQSFPRNVSATPWRLERRRSCIAIRAGAFSPLIYPSITFRFLDWKYKEWQKKLHPDLVHSKSEREYAAEQSACVIDAYRTLSKPLSRAIYILRLEGVDVDEELTVPHPELLTEFLPNLCIHFFLGLLQMKEKLEESSNSFANAYQSRSFDEAVTCIQRMTYYQRASEEILKKL
ncbi:hypothetical protein CRYUN_Cryun05aG0212100 [Craigia yunnanensis]